jgi:hypothetical protein
MVIYVNIKNALRQKGFTQIASLDLGETFFSIEKINSIRILLALAIHFDFEVHQFNIKTTFLHENIYMKLPKSLDISKSNLQQVWKLQKSIYDPHQSSKACYERLDTFLHHINFKQTEVGPTIYIQAHDNDNFIILAI